MRTSLLASALALSLLIVLGGCGGESKPRVSNGPSPQSNLSSAPSSNSARNDSAPSHPAPHAVPSPDLPKTVPPIEKSPGPASAVAQDEKEREPTKQESAAIAALKALQVKVDIVKPPYFEFNKSTISFYNAEKGDPALIIKALGDLKEATIHKAELWAMPLSDALLKALLEIRSLEEIEVSTLPTFLNETIRHYEDSPLTDAGIAALQKRSNLKSLGLRQTVKVSGDAWRKVLPTLTSLENLRLFECSLKDDVLPALSGLKGLKQLDLCGNPGITDAGLKSLSGLNKVTNLNLRGTSITDAGFEHLSGMTELEELNLAGPGIKDEGFKYLAKCKKLSSLHFREDSVNFTGTGLKAFAGQTFRYLDIDETGITDAGLAEIKNLKIAWEETLFLPQYGLTKYKKDQKFWEGLHPDRITDAGLKYLGEIRNIRWVKVGGGGITDAGLEHLTSLVNLRELEIGPCPNIKGPGLKALHALPALQELDISRTNVSAEHLTHLSGMAKLKKVIVGRNVTSVGLEKFKKANPNLEVEAAIFPEGPGLIDAKE